MASSQPCIDHPNKMHVQNVKVGGRLQARHSVLLRPKPRCWLVVFREPRSFDQGWDALESQKPPTIRQLSFHRLGLWVNTNREVQRRLKGTRKLTDSLPEQLDKTGTFVRGNVGRVLSMRPDVQQVKLQPL